MWQRIANPSRPRICGFLSGSKMNKGVLSNDVL
jgi:hypothetical protein